MFSITILNRKSMKVEYFKYQYDIPDIYLKELNFLVSL